MSMRDELDHLVFEMLTKGIRYDDAHREFEKRFISHALKKVEGNVGQAAELLGMHRNTLSRKIHEYRLRRTRLTAFLRLQLQLAVVHVDC